MRLRLKKIPLYATCLAWVEHNFNIVALIAALVAAALSLLIGMYQSVWFDEAYSILVAKQPIGNLIHLTTLDTHPPFYYLLLKCWAAVFGWGELSLRSLSVMAFGGSVFVALKLVSRLFSRRIAIYIIPALIFAPFLLRYGFEIRMYALAGLIGITATYILIVALQSKSISRQWLLFGFYGFLVALGVYTVYYTVLLWVAHLIWLACYTLLDKKKRVWQKWFIAYMFSLVLFLPWLPTLLNQYNNDALSPVVTTLRLEQLMSIVTFNFLYKPAGEVGIVGSFIVIFIIVACAFFGIRAYRYVDYNQRKYLTLLGLYAAVPIILLMLISLRKPMYVERYLAHVVVGAVLFIAVSVALVLSHRRSKRHYIIAGLLFIAMMSGSIHLIQIGNYNFQRSQQPTTDKAAAIVDLKCQDASTMVIAGDPYVAIELEYYLPDCDVYFYSETASLSGGYAPLSQSSLRLSNPVRHEVLSQRIYFVYDSEEVSLKLPSHYQKRATWQFNKLKIQEFIAE